MDTPGTVKIKEIISDFLLDIGDLNFEKEAWATNMAVRCFTDLNMFYIKGVSTTQLTVNDNGVSLLPPDFIDYTAVGVYNNGVLQLLSKNTDMYPALSGACGVFENDNPPADSEDTLYIFTGGLYVENWYGVPGHTKKHFQIHKSDGQRYIQFGGDIAPGATVLVEYVSSGVKLDAETFIPVQAKEAIIAYLDYRHEWRYGSKNASVVAEKRYKEEVNKLQAFENAPTKQEVLDQFFKYRKQTIGRV